MHRAKAFAAPPLKRLRERGSTRNCEGIQLTPDGTRDISIPYPCLAYKSGGRRKERKCRVMTFVFPSHPSIHDGALLSGRWVNSCLPMGSNE